jgi:hypothetical protein
MRQPTAAPAMAPEPNCGPDVCFGGLVAGLGIVDVGGAGCEDVGIGEVPWGLVASADVELLEGVEVVVWGGNWIAGIVVSGILPGWKVVVPIVEVTVFVGSKGTVAADRVIVESTGPSVSTVAVTK